ncbi:hypothetical protein [Aeromonas veronii]|uniref:hypothetical protein n=1 Tax=Aeromonas veronii TaxID=654 RepID=UPI003D1D5B8B
MTHTTKIKLIKSLSLAFIFLWVNAMITAPLIMTDFSWLEIQKVWDRWQTFNSGMIALLAAVLAIYAAQYSENAKRYRELIAAKSLLPLALSELHTYCTELATYLKNEFIFLSEKHQIDTSTTKENHEPPIPPKEWVFEAFKNCMIHEHETEAKFMASILSDMQITRARIESMKDKNNLITECTFSSHANDICLLHAKLGRMYDYSRKHSLLSTTEITDEEKNNSICVLDIECLPKYK